MAKGWFNECLIFVVISLKEFLNSSLRFSVFKEDIVCSLKHTLFGRVSFMQKLWIKVVVKFSRVHLFPFGAQATRGEHI